MSPSLIPSSKPMISWECLFTTMNFTPLWPNEQRRTAANVWNSLSDGVMWHVLLCRACVDAEFCAILLEVHAKGARLLHFERVGTKVLLGRLPTLMVVQHKAFGMQGVGAGRRAARPQALQ